MSLITELKRRNVIRMAGLYLVGSWLLVQVASTLFPAFGVPGWALRALVIVLALGFVPAVVFAWVFEMTPDGLKRDTEVPPGESIAPQTAQRMNRLIVAMLVLALAYFGFDKFVLAPKRQTAMVSDAVNASNSVKPPVTDKSIAVMPFLNMSSDQEQEYFSDGMTEEILNALAKVPNLAVTARTSVFSLKGQKHDIRHIGKLLGVAYVLEGSVRKAGDEVRITAQLIRADNGFHLWSETYDRKLENVFDLQAELAGAIAKALELPLGLGGKAALVSERSTDAQAYALYLQARSGYRARGSGVKQSIELYRAALKRDPKFAPAWAGLASSLAVLPWYVSPSEAATTPAFMREAEQAAKQALALSPDLPQAHTALATVHTFQWQWALAGKHFKRALELAPDDPEVHYNHADWLAAQGRLEDALLASQRAVALDPLVPIFMNGNANVFTNLGRSDEALALRQAAYALTPDVQLISNNLVATYIAAGRLDEAERVLDETRAATLAFAARNGIKEDPQLGFRSWIRAERDPNFREVFRKEVDHLERFNRLQISLGDIDGAFGAIEIAMDRHVSGVDPVIQLRSQRFAAYRKDPRYIRLLNKAGFDDQGNIR